MQIHTNFDTFSYSSDTFKRLNKLCSKSPFASQFKTF